MRNRSSAIAITTNTKKRISTELGFNNINDKDKLEKFTNFIEKEMYQNNKLQKRTSIITENTIDIPPPNYLDIKKEYSSKYDKPILFHDKAKVIYNLDKMFIGDIEKYSQHIDFQSFLAQFQSKEEISELEIQDLLDIDYEKLGEMKEKCLEYIDILSNMDEGDDNEDLKGYRKLMMFFCDKLNQIKKNEINIQVFINNIEKVDSLVFSNKKTQIFFDK